MSKPVEGGNSKLTKRQHLRAVWAQTGRKPEELELPEPPQDLMYLWIRLADFAYPLSFTELEAWCKLTGSTLAKWEIDVMTVLDRVRSNG